MGVLSSRVKSPNKDDWGKLGKLVHYLDGTRELHLVLRFENTRIARWYVDAAFGVHDDFKSQSSGTMFLSKKGGGIASGSTK